VDQWAKYNNKRSFCSKVIVKTNWLTRRTECCRTHNVREYAFLRF